MAEATDNGLALRDYADSVKQGDYNRGGGGVFYFLAMPPMADPLFSGTLPPVLPAPSAANSSQRDMILLGTPNFEGMWASALHIAISKCTALGLEIESSVSLRRKRAHELMLNAGAGTQFGWVPFAQMHLRQYFCSCKAVVEIEREGGAFASRVKAIHHLDSLRCRLTDDPDFPVIYTDRLGYQHEMAWYEVGIFSDMPDPTETLHGAGLCAADRAYWSIRKLAMLERYIMDKVGGQRPTAIYLVQGVSEQTLLGTIAGARAEQQAAGLSIMGAAIGPVMGDIPINLVTIPLAELPDGFNRKEEWDIAILTYANALGLDPQDLQPLTGQALGTGAQSQVLDYKAKGRGAASWRQAFSHFINELVLDDKTVFAFTEIDLRDERARADIAQTRATTRQTQIASGEITAQQALNMAVDAGDVPPEFLPADLTAGGSVTDADKPEAEEASQEAAKDTDLNDGGAAPPEPEAEEGE